MRHGHGRQKRIRMASVRCNRFIQNVTSQETLPPVFSGRRLAARPSRHAADRFGWFARPIPRENPAWACSQAPSPQFGGLRRKRVEKYAPQVGRTTGGGTGARRRSDRRRGPSKTSDMLRTPSSWTSKTTAPALTGPRVVTDCWVSANGSACMAGTSPSATVARGASACTPGSRTGRDRSDPGAGRG